MKDEYDFSGAVRGKFFRPGAKVKLPTFFLPPFSSKKMSRREWLGFHVTALVLLGNGESDLDNALLVANYLVHHIDGQDDYDLGGEA